MIRAADLKHLDRPKDLNRLWAGVAASILLLAACSPAPAPIAEIAAPAVPPAADPAVRSIVMAADPAVLGFDAAIFARAKAELEADVRSGLIPGAVLLIAKGGEVVTLTTVGQQGPADATPMSDETIFRIYSMSKPIVSIATMQLVEEGKIALDDPISKYIPEFANPKVLDVPTPIRSAGEVSVATPPALVSAPGTIRPATREITVRDLLSHKSGLIYGVFDPESELGKMYMAAGDTRFDITALDLAKSLAALPLKFDPGAKWHYSRSTDVLGAVIEVASGKTLDVLLVEKIFTPLGMNDTSFYLSAEQAPRLAQAPDKILLSTPLVKEAMLSGGGGLSSTTEDYFRFVEMLRNKGEYRGVRLIKPETLDAMLVDQMTAEVDRQFWFYGPLGGFGLGFGLLPISFTDPSAGNVFSWSGYAGTNMWVDPKNDITMVFMIQNNEASEKYPAKLREWVYGGLEVAPAAAPAVPAPQ